LKTLSRLGKSVPAKNPVAFFGVVGTEVVGNDSLRPSPFKVPPESPSKRFKLSRLGKNFPAKHPVAFFGTKAVGDDSATVSARAKSPVLGEASGWTVIQAIPEEGSDRIEEEVEEEQDQLVEDEEDELREEMEAAEVASIGTPHDESDDERDQVESEAIPSGLGQLSSPVVNSIPSEEMKDADLDGLSRGFLTR